jgi:chorismate mutase/prephenate dehydrogenase
VINLDTLRKKLENVDRQLLTLVKERQNLSHDIGQLKDELGLGTRDYGQETRVVNRARELAVELGITPEVAEELFLILIRSSLTVQEKQRVASAGEGSGRQVLVIGGAGQMGSWIVRFLASQGYSEIADPTGTVDGFNCVHDWQNLTLHHDIIVVAAPLAESNRILKALAERAPHGLVFDIGSLKTPLREGVNALRDAGVKVASIHPMFGPTTELLSGRHVIFVDVGSEEGMAQAREIFAPTMATLVEMDLDSHDRMIAYVLGLSHALNIIFFTALAESGEEVPKLAQMSSTTFDAQLGVARSVAEDNPYLYFEIQSLNEFGSESLDALSSALSQLLTVVKDTDEEGFYSMMKKGEQYLHGRNSNLSD